MLDDLKELFREGLEYSHTAGLLQQMANLTNILSTQYLKDGKKNEAIDIVCNMLQKHKEVPQAEQPPAAVETPQEDEVVSLDSPCEACPCP